MALQAVVPAPSFSSFSEKVFCREKLENVKYVVDKSIPSEGYELHVLKRKIVVRSSDDAGRFYALQTLSQLSSASVMHCGVVKDAPRFSWRGFMLDEARHFHGKEKVKELLDLMARYKLNRFHWHLADDQGWRVEIKAYPELCTVGAVGCYSDASAPARFYSQEDIREIVAYAANRHIVIIPEIDMPGHASAFTRAFPELAFGPRTVDPSKEKLYEVLRTIVGELADSLVFFPIALGGIVPKENLLLMIASQVVIKTLYEVIILPITIKVVAWLKRTEGMDVYDEGVSYSVI